MLPATLRIDRAFPSAEAALHPLNSALPWHHDVTGNVTATGAELRCTVGEGRNGVVYPVTLAVEHQADGCYVALTVERLPALPFAASFLWAVMGGALLFTTGELLVAGLFVGMGLAVGATLSWFMVRRSREAINRIAFFYGEVAWVPEPG